MTEAVESEWGNAHHSPEEHLPWEGQLAPILVARAPFALGLKIVRRVGAVQLGFETGDLSPGGGAYRIHFRSCAGDRGIMLPCQRGNFRVVFTLDRLNFLSEISFQNG